MRCATCQRAITLVVHGEGDLTFETYEHNWALNPDAKRPDIEPEPHDASPDVKMPSFGVTTRSDTWNVGLPRVVTKADAARKRTVLEPPHLAGAPESQD